MEYLIAVDLEGVHGVVGEPMKGLGKVSCAEEWSKAVESATVEINAAVRALYDSGATKVYVWDNHAGGGNLDPAKLDPRAPILRVDNSRPRMSFFAEHNFAGMLFIGYHAREGSPGILAHTYNSSQNQYMKVNGKQLGEFDFDACIAGSYGVPAIFAASDDVCLAQIKECNPETVTVLTKYAKGRNEAVFRDRADVEKDIYEGVKRAVRTNVPVVTMSFPCEYEVRYTRMEMAAWLKADKLADLDVTYGEDTHILKKTLKNIDEIRRFL
ncbi:MAG: M55 family metallopeptidase [Clostridia bacterium]|nr:M55 family metallopeptidase [Clostridia bacterium]